MSNKMKLIWLVDDSVASNLLNQKLIESLNKEIYVESYTMAESAINKLKKEDVKVDLILLDINMPAMDGWEFIEEFQSIKEKLKLNCRLILLSTSLNPKDRNRSQETEVVDQYIQKPLSRERLKDIL